MFDAEIYVFSYCLEFEYLILNVFVTPSSSVRDWYILNDSIGLLVIHITRTISTG